jgi:hypothetical protein
MPMKSKAQRAYLWIHEPKVAREFENHTTKGAKLPAHVKTKKIITKRPK